MPVAVRRKSWEEHVAHRTGLQYSFDDLDILCCHGIAYDGQTSGLEVSGTGRRERCASLPECGRELRAGRLQFTRTQAISVDADESDAHPDRGDFVPLEGSTETLVFEPDENSADGFSDSSCTEPSWTEPPETGASGKDTPLAEAPGDGADSRDKDSSPEDASETNYPTARSKCEEGPTLSRGSDKHSNGETIVPLVFADPQQDSTIKHLDLSPCPAADAQAAGTLGNSFKHDATPNEARSHPEASPPHKTEPSPARDEPSGTTVMEQYNSSVSQSDANSETSLSEATHMAECNGASANTSGISEDSNSDTAEGRTSEFDRSAFREDTEYEVSCYDGVGSPSCWENLPKLSGESANVTSNVDIIGEVPISGRNPSEEGEGQTEAKPHTQKDEDSIVKLRKRKGSKEERERSHLDSMVLLIMKLDQLDQDIENALTAASSISNTPTLKRRNVQGTDLEAINGADTFYPTHLQKLTPQMIYSALTSPGPTAAPGERPRTGTMPSISENDRAGNKLFGVSSVSNSESSSRQNYRQGSSTSERYPEIEAKEACDWLRAAGFPQYAQLYEDSLFPIEISSVTRDHDFLDRDAIEALCRRLNTLNKCAVMRLEITPQRKQSEDSDEDEPCAISARWTFQRDSKRWSRLEELDVFALPDESGSPAAVEGPGTALKVGVSAESVLSDLSEQPEVSSLNSQGSSTGSQGAAPTAATGANTRADSVASVCSSALSGPNEDRSSEGLPSPKELSVLALGGKPGGKSTRSKAKSFLKRMESLRLKSSPSKKKKVMTKLMIGEPVLQDGVDQEKLRRLNCVEISSLNGPGGPRSRSVSYSGQTSSSGSSSSSSQSEAGSSAVSTPSPVTRARSRSAVGSNNNKRGGMYLEGFDPFSLLHLQPSLEEEEPGHAPGQDEGDAVAKHNRRNQKEAAAAGMAAAMAEDEEDEEEEMIFFIPEGHKPGTFPKALRNGSPRFRLRRESSDGGSSKGSTRRNSAGSLDSRLSFYDNVPPPLLLLGRDGEQGEEEQEAHSPKLDDILHHVRGLQRFVNEWSEQTCEEGGDSDSALDSVSPCPSSPLQNRLEEAENGSDLDSTGNSVNEQDETLTARERRDSGVGASLTRSNRPQRLRWHSFQSSHRPSLSSALLQINCQSVLQMNLLQKFSLLKLTALLEKYTPANKHGFSWAVPKFMKRIKVRDYKDRSVFGVPLQVNVQRSGQPLPQSIQQAMRYLRSQCLDQVGLFRKSGVKSRIQALRQMNEACADAISYEGQSAYDVADMLKQYFRDLPEPLLTSKLSETFLQIYQYVPKDLRLQAIKAATLLLPDDHREALQTLLFFLSDVTANVAENQMTSTNLAVCLAPSLFHLNTLKRENSSPRVMHRKHSLGKPDQKDLNENLAATQGLAHMIAECKKLFQIPEEMSRCRNSYMEQGLHPPKLEDLGEAGPDQASGYRGFLKEGLENLLKEAREKFKGYDSYSTPEQTELACKKVHDGYPLRMWKATVEVPASPEEVLTRVLREQHRWDEDLLESKVVENLGNHTEVYQYVQNSMAPHPTRDHVLLRTWATDLPKGACAIFATSMDHDGAAQMGVRVNVLTARYFIEPCGSSKSRLTYICRTDCRGRFPEWYNKMFGHICAAEVGRVRDSFTNQPEK